MYLVRFKVSHNLVKDAVECLDPYFQTLSYFEDNTSPESGVLDENDFPVLSLFDVDIILQDKTQIHLIEFLLNDSKVIFSDLSINEIIDQDWLKACYQNFKPIIIEPFFIHSSYAPEIVPDHSLGLMIDAATAFGSGEHQTTRGCLTAISQIMDKGQMNTILDMGCGSGILGLACALKKKNATVLGADIDEKAVEVANNNAVLNRILNFKAMTSCGFENLENKNDFFDLIVANILARPLIAMADMMYKYAKPGAFVVLSGLLSRQKDDVLNAYHKANFRTDSILNIDDWTTCILRK